MIYNHDDPSIDDSNSCHANTLKISIQPEKLIGKDGPSVIERLKELGYSCRLIREHGLITADYREDRYTVVINESGTIIDCYMS